MTNKMKKRLSFDDYSIEIDEDGSTHFFTDVFNGTTMCIWCSKGVSGYYNIKKPIQAFLEKCEGKYVNTDLGVIFFELDKDAFYCKLMFGGELQKMPKE